MYKPKCYCTATLITVKGNLVCPYGCKKHLSRPSMRAKAITKAIHEHEKEGTRIGGAPLSWHGRRY